MMARLGVVEISVAQGLGCVVFTKGIMVLCRNLKIMMRWGDGAGL